MSETLFIDLLSKYRDSGMETEIREKFSEFKHKIKGFAETDGTLSVGDVIEFFGGFNNDIRYSTEIIGFSHEGEIYLLWDCYWYPIKNEEKRNIVKYEEHGN